jgi:hypothetical protein
MSIRTVLITLTTLFHNKPLLNEPGITEKHHAFESYNKIIEYRNIDTAIRNVLTQKILPDNFKPLWPLIKQHFIRKKNDIIKKIDSLIEKNPKPKEYRVSIYSMNCTVDYEYIKNKLKKAYKTIE